MRVVLQGNIDSEPLEFVSQLVVVADAVILVLLLVALGGFAYKSLYGDGIQWPDDDEAQGSDDTEWKYD